MPLFDTIGHLFLTGKVKVVFDASPTSEKKAAQVNVAGNANTRGWTNGANGAPPMRVVAPQTPTELPLHPSHADHGDDHDHMVRHHSMSPHHSPIRNSSPKLGPPLNIFTPFGLAPIRPSTKKISDTVSSFGILPKAIWSHILLSPLCDVHLLRKLLLLNKQFSIIVKEIYEKKKKRRLDVLEILRNPKVQFRIPLQSLSSIALFANGRLAALQDDRWLFVANSKGIVVSEFGPIAEGCRYICATQKSNILFLSDFSDRCIIRLDFRAAGKTSIQRFGAFLQPSGVALFEEENSLIVCDRKNRVLIYTLDGVLKHTFGQSGSCNGEFNDPSGVACDDVNGNIYVCDTNNHRVQIFSSSGEWIRNLGGDGRCNCHLIKKNSALVSDLLPTLESVLNSALSFSSPPSSTSSSVDPTTCVNKLHQGKESSFRGKDSLLRLPFDVEVTGDGKYAFVIDMSPYISVFDISSGNLIGRISDPTDEEEEEGEGEGKRRLSSQLAMKRWRSVRMDDAGRLFVVSRSNITVF